MNNFFFNSSENEFVLAHFHLAFQQPFHLGLPEMLLLRRDLLIAAHHALGDRHSKRFQELFDPPLPYDPVALRRFQRPSPPFAILVEPETMRDYAVGDCLDLAVSFWGRGGQLLVDFALVLQTLGSAGFHRGQGLFELSAIEAEDASANRTSLWTKHEKMQTFAPPFNEVGWWLSRNDTVTSVRLELLTPARLISQGRPVFQLDFKRLFPFVLRRVTSVLYAFCGREVIVDPGSVLAAASAVREHDNSFRWQDWRTLESRRDVQDLGGIVGSVLLGGEALQDLLGILRLGSLMNIGKGASFGTGRLRLLEENSC